MYDVDGGLSKLEVRQELKPRARVLPLAVWSGTEQHLLTGSSFSDVVHGQDRRLMS